jgi:hypothetical protein
MDLSYSEYKPLERGHYWIYHKHWWNAPEAVRLNTMREF